MNFKSGMGQERGKGTQGIGKRQSQLAILLVNTAGTSTLIMGARRSVLWVPRLPCEQSTTAIMLCFCNETKDNYPFRG